MKCFNNMMVFTPASQVHVQLCNKFAECSSWMPRSLLNSVIKVFVIKKCWKRVSNLISELNVTSPLEHMAHLKNLDTKFIFHSFAACSLFFPSELQVQPLASCRMTSLLDAHTSASEFPRRCGVPVKLT